MIDPDLAKWIIQSCSKTMMARTGLITSHSGMEPEETPSEGVEMRIDGPRFNKEQGQIKIWVAINFLVTVKMSSNILTKHEITGELVSILEDAITVVDESSNTVGCLEVLQDPRNGIRINHFGGPIRKDVHLEQSTVEARYEMII